MCIYLPLGLGLRAVLAGGGLGRKQRMRRASGLLLLTRRQAPWAHPPSLWLISGTQPSSVEYQLTSTPQDTETFAEADWSPSNRKQFVSRRKTQGGLLRRGVCPENWLSAGAGVSKIQSEGPSGPTTCFHKQNLNRNTAAYWLWLLSP